MTHGTKLSDAELQNQQLNPDTLRLAIDQVKSNGYVLFESALPLDFVTAMHTALIELLHKAMAENPSNRGANRYQMHLPFAPPFSDERLVANSLLLPILDALMATDYICHYLASDNALPGSEYQPTHADIHPLFPEMPIPLPPYSIVLNVPLVDVTEENGPVEIWPGGTHNHMYPQTRDMAEVAPLMHSVRVTMPAGSLLLRDSRMWHRGTPNNSDIIRPHVALIYSRHWLSLRYPRIEIAQADYDRLSERAQHLFRREKILT